MSKRKRIPTDIAAFWRRLMNSSISLEQILRDASAPDRAGAATVGALMFALRAGVGRLADRKIQTWLRALDEAQLVEVATRLQKFNPDISAPWSARDVAVLIAAKRNLT